MASKKALAHLKDREGVKYKSYLDSLKKPTAGVGHLLSADEQKLYPIGTKIPEAQVNKWLKEDLAKAETAAKTQADQMRAKGLAVDPNFEESLISVNFQLGTGWTKKFPSAWSNLQSGDYEGAISQIQFADPNKKPGVESSWAKQTPVRVDDFTQAIRNQAGYKEAPGVSPYEPQMPVAENTTFGAPKPREEVITEKETVTEEGPGFYDRFTSGIKELLPFNEGGPVEEQTTTTETIDVLPSDNYYRNYMMQEAARRSMMQGNEEERMADYEAVKENPRYYSPTTIYNPALPQMQAAQRIMGGYTEGGRVSSPQGLASLGRGGDSTLVHMQPREVAGLQQLAQSNGTSLTRNPMTGYPEAFSLGGMFKAALPIAAGYFAPGSQFLTGAGGLGMTAGNAALAAGAATGAGLAAATGDDPIMGAVSGGMGGYSGMGLAPTAGFGAPTQLATSIPQTATKPIGMFSNTAGVSEAITPTVANAGNLGTNLTTSGGVGIDPNAGFTDATMKGNVATQGYGDPYGRVGSLDEFRATRGIQDSPGKLISTGELDGKTMDIRSLPTEAKPLTPMQTAMRLGSPVASMGLGGLEESDFMVKPDFNDPRDVYNPRSTLDLSRDTGVSEAMSRDTGLRLLAKGGYINGPGDGMSDDIPATINGDEPAALADGEFVIPADVVSHLGNGSSAAGSKQLHAMMERIRQARTGRKSQGKEIKPGKYMPR